MFLTKRKTYGTRPKPCNWLSRDWKKYEVARGSLVVRLIGKKWWGLTAFELLKGSEVLPLLDAFNTYKDLTNMKRRNVSSSTPEALHLAAMESALFAQLHPCVAHCAETLYDDKSARKPGWITMKTMGSAWVLEAKDPDSCSRLTAVQPALDDAWALLALLLDSEQAPWERDTWLAQQASKSAKKK